VYIIWLIRKMVKRVWLKLGGQVVEYCKRCGRRQPLVWGSSDPLWAKITGRTDGSGVFCPECFDFLAKAKGLHLYWVPKQDGAFN